MTFLSMLRSCLPDRALRIRSFGLSLFAFFLLDGTAHSASFPCEQSRSAVEKEICRNPELSTLDEHLGQYFAAARSALKPAESCLVSDQRNWLRVQRDACGDAACLRQAYLRRLAELDPLQPGVTRIRHIELPRVKALVWIVPAALDQVAAPVSRKAKPLVARGAILNEVSGGGDGFVLNAGDGKRLLIVPLMFLEPPTMVALESLSRIGGEYEVRGHSEVSSDGHAHFAPSRCVFVHRIS